MRYIATAVLILSASICLADGPTTISGTNDSGERITVHQEYFDYGPEGTPWGPNQYHTVKVTKGEKLVHSYEKQLCGSNELGYRPGWRFSCRKEGTSPLAGTTYSFVKELPDCQGYLFACTQGCGARAPRELVKEPWECNTDEMVELEKEMWCGKDDRIGKNATLVGDNVNLRGAPNTYGEIIRTLASGTKVRVVSQAEKCATIGSKTGRWVKVRSMDSSFEDGWLFDAYVNYE